MKSSQRVFVNTIAQYVRTVIVMLLTLYIVRVVLATLGQSDYGIYTVVAGCVAMLGFLTNSLIRTTQRFVSFYQGKKDVAMLKDVFNNCLVVHLLIGFFVVILLEALSPFFFNGFLNIPLDRLEAASVVYHFVIALLFVTITTSPFRALLISHENIIYISFIDVLDIVLKVVLVLFMRHITFDKLIFYGVIMLGVQLFNFLALSLYCYKKYEECILPQLGRLRFEFVKEMGMFAGWQVYGTACTIGRDQGLSIVLNKAFDTIVNAGLGIGVQISGAASTLATAITNAMSPQIVKAEGAGERGRTIWLSNVLSKMVFFLVSILGIPLIFELPDILDVWLGDYPESAVLFGRMYIIALMADSLTIGLTHINNAIGNIGKYILIMNTPKLLSILFVVVMLKLNSPLLYVCYLYVGIELICTFVRVPLIKEQAGLSVSDFLSTVILMEIIPIASCAMFCSLMILFFDFRYRFIVTFVISAFIYSVFMYLFGFTKREKNIINTLLKEVKCKIIK